jgi:hypothetical protein
LDPLKSVFNIFIFLAITAFALDVMSTFATKNATEDVSKLNDQDEEPDSDSDDPCDPDGEKEEGETNVKGLLFGDHFCVSSETVIILNKDYFGEVPDFCEFHLIAPPYSPPELL